VPCQIGAATSLVLMLLESVFPRYRHFIPSAVGFGLAFTLTASNTISMFVGATLALLLGRMKPATAERYTIPVSSGIIAGESLVGIAIKARVIVHVLQNPP
jgi:uncharacterized oligopeptide transporter (OPT) family protein